MFFEAEVKIKSNTEELMNSRRREEGACDVCGGCGDRIFRRTDVPMNMISDFDGFS